METKGQIQLDEKDCFRVEYGVPDNFADVTMAALQTCLGEDGTTVTIPFGEEERGARFGDPCFGIIKVVRLCHSNGFSEIVTHSQTAQTRVRADHAFINVLGRLTTIHSKLQLIHGGFHEEFPEQVLACAFVSKDAKVLELGANVGRNTLVIAAILSDANNLVTLECCPESFSQLLENRSVNTAFFGTRTFRAENAALSSIALMQKKWDTFPIPADGIVPEDFEKVQTITFKELEAKYQITFDTLVADCEGALFYIFQQDAPNVLKNIKMIIMENDFHILEHKIYVDKTLQTFGFKRSFAQAGGWGPCAGFFYEVWSK